MSDIERYSPLGEHSCDDVYMCSDPDGEWIYHTEFEKLKKENEELRQGYKEAVQDIEGWAAYASDYFKEKHDLAGDLKVHRNILTKDKGVRNENE